MVVVFGTGAVDQGLGMTAVAEGVSVGQSAVAEELGTFLLMFTIMAVAVHSRAPLRWTIFSLPLTRALNDATAPPFAAQTRQTQLDASEHRSKQPSNRREVP